MKRTVLVLALMGLLAFTAQITAFAASNDDWDVRLIFSVGTAQDPLDLVVGVDPNASLNEPKPPLPPGMARTGDPTDATISAFVVSGSDSVYQAFMEVSEDLVPSYIWEINVDSEVEAAVSLEVDLANKPTGLTLTLFDPEDGTKEALTGTTSISLPDLYTADGETKTLYLVAAAGGGGFVTSSGGNVKGAASLYSNAPADRDHSGISVFINDNLCDTTDESGLFSCSGSLSAGDDIKFTKSMCLNMIKEYEGESLGVPTLAGGDANEDNCVNGFDFSYLQAAYGIGDCGDLEQGYICTDFDGDNDVDGMDFAILQHYYKVGGDVSSPGDAAGCD